MPIPYGNRNDSPPSGPPSTRKPAFWNSIDAPRLSRLRRDHSRVLRSKALQASISRYTEMSTTSKPTLMDTVILSSSSTSMAGALLSADPRTLDGQLRSSQILTPSCAACTADVHPSTHSPPRPRTEWTRCSTSSATPGAGHGPTPDRRLQVQRRRGHVVHCPPAAGGRAPPAKDLHEQARKRYAPPRASAAQSKQVAIQHAQEPVAVRATKTTVTTGTKGSPFARFTPAATTLQRGRRDGRRTCVPIRSSPDSLPTSSTCRTSPRQVRIFTSGPGLHPAMCCVLACPVT